MQHFIGLPTEILLWVFESLGCVRDAIHLSQCCKVLNRLFNDRRYQAKILESIVLGVSSKYVDSCDLWLTLTLLGRITSSQKPQRQLA